MQSNNASPFRDSRSRLRIGSSFQTLQVHINRKTGCRQDYSKDIHQKAKIELGMVFALIKGDKPWLA